MQESTDNGAESGRAVAQRLRDEPMELTFLVVRRNSVFYDRRHEWVTFDPTRASPWLVARQEDRQAGLRSESTLDVDDLVNGSEHDDGELVRTAFVPIERTPIPFRDAPLVDIHCPNHSKRKTRMPVRKPLAERKRECELCGEEVTPVVQ